MHQSEAKKDTHAFQYGMGPRPADILETRTKVFWVISSCYHDRLDTATQAAMTVGKANNRLTAILKKVPSNSLLHMRCAELQSEIIRDNG